MIYKLHLVISKLLVPVTLNIWQQGKDGNMKNSKNVIVLTGAGQLGMAIARRMGYGNKIFVADWKIENA
ncbi:hypothetical protein [Mucilaginibacter rubeus]|uniref:hypothetical protein n=1 Tax=Mucilaginibacter rubeus TaxID=2027860 RepID=UPI001AA10FC7|nr:hypothetical protein [Mucilaginibacter rubeus]QTE60392.1 hypothetical protein J3L23_08605 [Mucilaginibacter rubeus]QTE66980.1 hypothetical protein J3L22_25260 [Mucilaginibacter rubeus]QTF65792.1 hypothetical protein J3L20_24890 [Mucilaginibacter rubeus]